MPLIVCYGTYMRTNSQIWSEMFRFWRRIFAVGFALGVVSGIVMTFEFAMDSGPFPHDVGPILGVIIAMEVLTAFSVRGRLFGVARLRRGPDQRPGHDDLDLHGQPGDDPFGQLDPGCQLVDADPAGYRTIERALPAEGLGPGYLKPLVRDPVPATCSSGPGSLRASSSPGSRLGTS